MKRIKFLAMLVLLTFVGRAFADNLKVNDITLNAGATQEIAIEMVNPDKTYTAFQFDLVLPEGITIAKNARNKLIASLNADRIDDQTLNVSEVGNNTYRFISFSMSNAEFYDAEGPLVYVTLAAAEDITGGTKVATIASQVITEVSGDQYKWDDLSFNITVPSAGIAIDATNFPDENFRAWLLSQDYGQDALLTEEEIEGVTEINVSQKGIADLTGIELFTNLTYLNCYDNQLTSLDVTKNVALTALDCRGNKLTSLDVSNNVALTWLDCKVNQLTSLDVSKNVALTSLYCRGNPLTSLDVSNNVALTVLECSYNQLTSLDLTKNVELTGLYCGHNQIKDTAMDELISSLPTIASGGLYAMYPPEWGEGNVITPAQVAAANAKGWKVFQWDVEAEKWVEMSGEVAPTGIAIDATNFPDENFRAWLLSQDYGQDALLTQEEIEGITEIDVSEKEIADLTGIEIFTKLTVLWCNNNQLTSLDVTKNVALTWLSCRNNQLTSLDVSKNTTLTHLGCHNNQLTSLDVSKNTALVLLNCDNNQLTSLDVSKNVALTRLSCSNNQLTSLDVSNNVALTMLGCSQNQLTSLDATKNIALKTLSCYNNQIKDSAMDELISSLPTVASGNLDALFPPESGEGNVITPAQVAAANAKGWKVWQYNAEAHWVEMSGEVAPTGIAIDATNFPDDNFRAWLLSQDYGQDALLTQEEIAGITEINVSEKEIADLTGIELFTNLTYLWCNYNQLTSLDVSKNTTLKTLYCWGNQLTSLDVTNNVALQQLYCGNNQLTSLDVSKNTALQTLYCNNNQLTSLDVSKNVALVNIECNYNQLTSLDVSKNVALEILRCPGNQLTSLDVTNNVALQQLYCFNNQIKDSAMEDLISSLPAGESKNMYAIGLPEWGEGNEITSAQVAAANAKGWKVFQMDAEAQDWVEMSGEVAPTGIAIDATNFPDENFRAWLLSQDYGQDALLTEEEIEGITVINVSERGIADLTGIELFTNLTYLRCGGNQLTSLDLSKNVELQRLYCFNNQLTSLDVSNNVKLQRLHCYNNQIKDTAMDELISSLPTVDSGNLYAMYPPESGEGNEITPAQVAAANAKGWKVFKYQYGRDWVEMSGEEPPAGIAIDATNFPDDNFRAWLLRQDYGQDGVLTEEEIQAVTEIDVHQKGISVLKGIEFFTALTTLECSSNQLTSLDVSLNTALVGLYCNVNQLTSLDVSKNTALTQLYCGDNQLTSLDVSKNTTLTHLGCHNNQLTSLDVSKNTALTQLYCGDNQLTSLDVSKNTALTHLSCDNNQLTSLDVTTNTALMILYCDNNQLTSLDLTNNDELMTLYCDGNQLTSLDVTNNVALEYLYCEANKLTSLDVSYNTALVRLFCGHNQLTSLDVTKNVALTVLYCYNNQLKSLDVTNNVALTHLSIICNQISGTEMDKLVSSLPSIDSGYLFAIDYTQEEGNVVTPKQVSAANARGWKVIRWDAETERYVEMSGEDPDGIQSTDKGQLTVDDAVIYNLSGQRLSKPQRGVNIINGKKMVVK